MYVDRVYGIMEVLGPAIRAEEVGDVILVSKSHGMVERSVMRAALVGE